MTLKTHSASNPSRRVRPRSIARLVIAAVAGTSTILALAACTQPEPVDDGPTSIIIDNGVDFEPNPFEGGHLFGIEAQAVYDPLIMVAGEGVDPLPWLASSWEIAPDGTSITFQLRDDVDFVDGTHMDAAGLETYFTALFESDKYTWKARVVD